MRKIEDKEIDVSTASRLRFWLAEDDRWKILENNRLVNRSIAMGFDSVAFGCQHSAASIVTLKNGVISDNYSKPPEESASEEGCPQWILKMRDPLQDYKDNYQKYCEYEQKRRDHDFYWIDLPGMFIIGVELFIALVILFSK